MFKVSYDGSNKKVLWQEMWRHEFLAALEHDPVVIVPTGSIEQHGPHCPMDVDIVGPFYMAVRTAQRVDDFPVIVAPPVHFGFTHYNKGFPGTISLRIETYLNLVGDVCRSISDNGFRRIVVINGHGGNNAPNHVVRDTVSEENIFVVAYSWWQSATEEMKAWSEADEGSVGHGGEWETSLVLHISPEVVDMSRADDGDLMRYHSEFVAGDGFVGSQQVTWSTWYLQESNSGIYGAPTVASAETGQAIMEAAVDNGARFLVEFWDRR